VCDAKSPTRLLAQVKLTHDDEPQNQAIAIKEPFRFRYGVVMAAPVIEASSSYFLAQSCKQDAAN
jgi:hypothetical protein